MSNLKVRGYDNLESFKRDFEIYRANPKDKVFAKAVSERIFGSTEDVFKAIKYEMLNILMESNPKEFIRLMTLEAPKNSWIFIKSKEDPFFEV